MVLIIALLSIYLAGQYGLAWWMDNGRARQSGFVRAAIYALSLAVYNGSWFYLASVGTASHFGWNYLNSYLGATLAITLFFPVWRRIARIVKHENIGSIADFLSSRYGKSRILGTIVACVTIAASLPYLAGQLRSLSMAWSVASGSVSNTHTVLIVFATLLAGFVILFGARKPTLTDHNRGLIAVTAFDSLFKFSILTVMGLLAMGIILSATGTEGLGAHLGSLAKPMRFDGGFFNTTFLGVVVMFCAPRQFYVAFVELEDLKDLNTARWLWPLYLVIAALAVIPLSIAGGMIFGSSGADIYTLKLAQLTGGSILTALVFVGAVSCVAAVVTVEAVALSAMVSNDLVLPAFARLGWRPNREADVSHVIVNIRRAAILVILALSWLYCRYLRDGGGQGGGLVAAAGLAQLMPALIGGLYWRRGHVAGAVAGIIGGFMVWMYYIEAPQFLVNFGIVKDIGLRLAASAGTDQFVQKVLLTLIVNTTLYITGSLLARPRMVDRIQAAAFVDMPREKSNSKREPDLFGTVGTLKALVAQFMGAEAAGAAFAELGEKTGRPLRENDTIDVALVRGVERILAGVIGSSLARNVLGWQLSDHGREPADVVRVLDDAALALQFNRNLLEAALTHLSHGVYVVDRDSRLEVWNDRYAEITEFPPGFLYVGRPISEVIRFVLQREGRSDAEIEAYIREKLRHIRDGTPHVIERQYRNGRVLKTIGTPMPQGHYVTSFSDVTELHLAADVLRRSNEQLEKSVELRTAELTEVNVALEKAKSVAERASHSQARFLAAASHDLLQPLHAARLFMGALHDELPVAEGGKRELARAADKSIDSANRLLRALLNLSRLEVGGLSPEVKPVDVNALLLELKREFSPIARDKGLELRILPRRSWVLSDPDLLRSVLQNLVGNAIRYTPRGSVILGCRNDKAGLRFEIRDSGPGIPADALDEIFREFSRLPGGIDSDTGAGLGLAIAERVCKLLGHELRVWSRLGQGSTFMVIAPLARSDAQIEALVPHFGQMTGLKVLCVENEGAILASMKALLVRWGVHFQGVATAEEALALPGTWDVILADYQLDEKSNGLDLIEALSGRASVAALVTANGSEAVLERAARLGVEIIRKPVAPSALRIFLTRAWRNVAAAAE